MVRSSKTLSERLEGFGRAIENLSDALEDLVSYSLEDDQSRDAIGSVTPGGDNDDDNDDSSMSKGLRKIAKYFYEAARKVRLVEDKWYDVKEIIGRAYEVICEFLSKLSEMVKEAIKFVLEKVKEMLVEAFAYIRKVLTSVLEFIKSLFGSGPPEPPTASAPLQVNNYQFALLLINNYGLN